MNDDQDASRNTLPPQAGVAANVEAAADADNRIGYVRDRRQGRREEQQAQLQCRSGRPSRSDQGHQRKI